jgi:hypothetical protein
MSLCHCTRRLLAETHLENGATFQDPLLPVGNSKEFFPVSLALVQLISALGTLKRIRQIFSLFYAKAFEKVAAITKIAHHQ